MHTLSPELSPIAQMEPVTRLVEELRAMELDNRRKTVHKMFLTTHSRGLKYEGKFVPLSKLGF